MIRTEQEYRLTVERLQQGRDLISRQREEMCNTNMTEEQIAQAISPLESFYMQLQEEVDAYERLCRGELGELENIRSIGHLLIAGRIARGMTQRQLAGKLDVHESLVSRDERNEYHGITLDRAAKILDALGVSFHATAKLKEPANSEPVLT